MSRTILYITPYFPPATKVGALRPLKFLRHLSGHGYRAIVLADLRSSDKTDRGLFEEVPRDVDVRFEYSAGAQSQFARALSATSSSAGTVRRPTKKLEAPAFLKWSPEYVPLGEHGPRVPSAIKAARRIVAREKVDVILVNADPYAAMVVGDRVGRTAGIPVVHDLRDPWSVCDLRRPNRPRVQRAIVDKLERGIVERCARMVLNSATTLAAYRAHYADVDPDRFTCIRNHGDAALVAHGEPIERRSDDPFTVLFLGNFRRFLQGDALLGGLAELRRRGHGPEDVRLAVTGHVTAEAREQAAALGVADMLEERPFVQYSKIGATMDAADLLIANIPSRMRVPAKFYDYAMSRRPILALGDRGHAELRGLAEGLPGARFAASDDPSAVASAMVAAFEDGRQVDVDRVGTGLDSETATARLAGVLGRAIDGGDPV